MVALMLLSFLLLFWAYVLYPIFLLMLKNSKVIYCEAEYKPHVSIVIVAHNEEKVVEKTILSCLAQDYPKNLTEIVVASDHSTDNTVSIAEKFAAEGVRVIQTKERKGRANAHNEACSTIDSEVIAFCDANTIWAENTLSSLIDSLKSKDVGYVSGALHYINTADNYTSGSEGLYWKYELFLRKLESLKGSITAGNGAVYAIKRTCYEPINPLYSHDIVLPSMVVKKGFRSVFNPGALAYEKAGETTSDEYARKVRMFGRAWHFIFNSLDVFNPFKVGLKYSIFMFSHRLLRYSAGILQLVVLISSIFLAVQGEFSDSYLFSVFLLVQFGFYVLVLLGKLNKLGRLPYLVYYFNLFHIATFVGFFNAVTNRVKPFWLSPQTTRK